MSEEKNLEKLSVEDLEKEKLQAEIDILKARLSKEYPDDKPRGRFDKLAGFARKWSAFILGTVTLISAIFGVFVPLAQYLEERRNALKYDLNENMIGFVDDMMSGNPDSVNRGIMMLSYYEINSVPILLYFLSKSDQRVEKQKMIENITWIHFDNPGNDIVEMVMGRMQYNFEKLKIRDNDGDYFVDNAPQRAIFNYVDLLKELKLSGSECRMIDTKFNNILDKMDDDPDDFYDTNPDAKGVRNKITTFIESNEDCK